MGALLSIPLLVIPSASTVRWLRFLKYRWLLITSLDVLGRSLLLWSSNVLGSMQCLWKVPKQVSEGRPRKPS